MPMQGLRRIVAGAIVLAAVAAAPARGDEITDWNKHATDALIVTAGQGPTVAVQHLAMVHGAIYDAVNSIDGGRQPYVVAVAADGSESKAAAAAAAAYRVLATLLPTQQPALEAKLLASLAALPAGPARDAGVAVGDAAGVAMLAARTGDGRFGSFRFSVGTLPGEWRPVLPAFVNDPAGWLARMRPFLLERGDQFDTPGPTKLTSEEYAEEFAEVKLLGRAGDVPERTADQTDMARFWFEHPVAMWSRMFRSLADGHIDRKVDSARYYAMLYLTAADSLIACWHDKDRWSFWRPITAIREADTDGNPATTADPDWLPLLPTPPYPEHPSGHGCLSGSIAATMRDYFGTDKVAFGTVSAFSGTERTFAKFSEAAREVIEARVYSGMHFHTSDRQGVKLGERVARWRQQHWFATR